MNAPAPNATCPWCGEPVIEFTGPDGVVRLQPGHGTRQVPQHATFCTKAPRRVR